MNNSNIAVTFGDSGLQPVATRGSCIIVYR